MNKVLKIKALISCSVVLLILLLGPGVIDYARDHESMQKIMTAQQTEIRSLKALLAGKTLELGQTTTSNRLLNLKLLNLTELNRRLIRNEMKQLTEYRRHLSFIRSQQYHHDSFKSRFTQPKNQKIMAPVAHLSPTIGQVNSPNKVIDRVIDQSNSHEKTTMKSLSQKKVSVQTVKKVEHSFHLHNNHALDSIHHYKTLKDIDYRKHDGYYRIQVGCFSKEKSVRDIKKMLENEGFKVAKVRFTTAKGVELTKVVVLAKKLQGARIIQRILQKTISLECNINSIILMGAR